MPARLVMGLSKAVQRDPLTPAITDLAPEVPPSLALVIHQLIQRKPEDRVPSARELVRRLAEVEARNVQP